jgi:hypothetical protein
MWTRVQAAHTASNAASSSLGFANPKLYALGKSNTAGPNDFFDIASGANGLPTIPRTANTSGWDYPTGWGTPRVANLIKDANGIATTKAVSSALPSGPDPAPIFAGTATTGPPPCSFAFRDPAPDAALFPPFFVTPAVQQMDNLDIVEGDFGMTADGKLRAVLTIMNLDKTLAPGTGFNEYTMYWQKPGDPTYYATDVTVDATGKVKYFVGTMTFTPSTFGFTPSATATATGSFGSGRNGRVEVDVALSDIGSPKLGDVITTTGGITSFSTDFPAPIATTAGNAGQAMDMDPGTDPTTGAPVGGNPYTLGASTCLDVPPGGIPEVPLPMLVPAIGAVIVVTYGAWRRRRAGREAF